MALIENGGYVDEHDEFYIGITNDIDRKLEELRMAGMSKIYVLCKFDHSSKKKWKIRNRLVKKFVDYERFMEKCDADKCLYYEAPGDRAHGYNYMYLVKK
jgi:predicted GIY-YIG superfamily endonuclease